MKICKYVILLLFVSVYNLQAQSWLKVQDSNNYYPFFGRTNDYIYMKGKPYMLSESLLSIFKDYESIYDISDELKYTIQHAIPISRDKDYDITWSMGPDSIIYLCQTGVWDGDELNQKIWNKFNNYVDLQASINLPGDKFLLYHLNPSKYMRHIPVEQLTGQQFQPSPYFPKILDIPLNENGVLPAVWFSDTLYVKPRENALEDQDGPYQQLIVKNGRVMKVNKIVPIIQPRPPRRKQ